MQLQTCKENPSLDPMTKMITTFKAGDGVFVKHDIKLSNLAVAVKEHDLEEDEDILAAQASVLV